MPDFTQGWEWFAAGLGATIVTTILLLMSIAGARYAERHERG
jgi:hypothetical protein